MDPIYFWILILFFIILILDFSDKYLKKKENFENELSDAPEGKNYYFEENNVYKFNPPTTSNAVNFNKPPNFSNFATSGITPSYVKCPSCLLQYDCSNFPYDVDDKNVSTCTKCFENTEVDSNNFPVYAKAVGKPRVCKNLVK
jgi:hypothetical protein